MQDLCRYASHSRREGTEVDWKLFVHVAAIDWISIYKPYRVIYN